MKIVDRQIICFLLITFLATPTLWAQKGKEKVVDKEKQVLRNASDYRLERDSRYAAGQREPFNRSSWIGSKLSELIQKWGPPSRMVEDGAGGKIAVYDFSSTTQGGSYKPGYIETATNGIGQTVITGSKAAEDTRWTRQYNQSTAVFADKNGIIQKVSFDNDSKVYTP